jgi:O-antigen/teichoic acid export membrane protein
MRGESELQRIDRNFIELLQELRVAQTGVQILFAFLLGLAFTPRFAALPPVQYGVYLTTLVLSASSAALLIAPVSYHRTVFRRRLKAQLVQTGHRYAQAGLLLLMLALVGAVELAASLVLGGWAAALAAGLAAAFIVLWFVVPLRHRNLHRRHPRAAV